MKIDGDPVEFAERQKRIHVETFLERLAFRARRSGDSETAREASRLLTIAHERPLPPEALGWTRGWWEYLAALDSAYFPGLYRAARSRGLASPLWRFGSALNYTDEEFRAHGEKVGAFVEEKMAKRGLSRTGTTVEALVSDMGKVQD